MAEDNLKDFLRQQARGLDSLLELTPAKHMFGEDNSDQWQRKKQTPEEKRAARMAKLDPANWKSAKDVYDERSAEGAKKRKRGTGDVDDSTAPVENADTVPSLKKQKNSSNGVATKVKSDKKISEIQDKSEMDNPNFKRRMNKRANKLIKNAALRERKEAAKQRKVAEKAGIEIADNTLAVPEHKTSTIDNKTRSKKDAKSKKQSQETNSAKIVPVRHKVQHKVAEQAEVSEASEVESDAEGDADGPDVDMDEAAADSSSVVDEDLESVSSATSSESVDDILSPTHDSASSSVSSVQPPLEATATAAPELGRENSSSKSKPDQNSSAAPVQQSPQAEADKQAARERLQSQISQFRTQRRADDRPIRSRAELLEERRRKENERKAAKKEQRRKEKEEEALRQDEEIARRFSPGGSVSGSLLGSPRSPMIDDGDGKNAFTFGRIAFADGSSFDPTTNQAADPKKRKGPSDAASALRAAEAKQGRIAGLDDGKKADIAEKDMWLNAKKRAHGEKVRDDTSLLKKALKRQEKTKGKSGQDWNTRKEGVQASQEAKQKRRTTNLQKRKDEKGVKGAKKGKPVKRAGFEGSFSGRTGKSKK